MIYRIAEAQDWQLAQQAGKFISADLAAEGFIHASEKHQILRTANKYYRGKSGLHLLEIDDRLLGAAVVREDLTGSGMTFPHIYAPIPLWSVLRFFDLVEGAGGFVLPAPLAD
ncbi:MAG: DUF952 domain-containing protein [Betaproteobacteria bacterium]